jgi:acetoin utilization deacetylase AcuC-like enzyme
MKTGIFFHYQKGERLRDFPQALKGILEEENVFLYDAFYPSKAASSFDLEPIPLELIYQVHSSEMVEQVKTTGSFEGALLSAAGTVRAAEKILTGEIDNAFVFTGYGDHHAGTDFFGGGCYFNGVAIAIQMLRKRFGAKRFIILDTDAHHGDGTWEIFGEDPDILYVCFCSNPNWEENNKVNIHVPSRVTDKEYLELIRESFSPRAKTFRSEILFWNWGYDGTQGEYGDVGLSPDFHISLAKELKIIVNEISEGRFIVVLCGGSRRDLARYLIPKILEVLSKHNINAFCQCLKSYHSV